MIDTFILHKQLSYEEKNRLMKLIPKKKHWRKREQLLYNGAIRLTVFIREDYYYLRLTVHSVSDFLEVEQVTNNHYDLLIRKLVCTLNQYDLDIKDFDLREIHYKLDIRVNQIEMMEYLTAISKCKNKYYNTEKVIYRDGECVTGIKFKPRGKTKSSKECAYESTIYNKDFEMSIRSHKFREHLQNILRFEIKVKKRTLDRYKRQYGIEKSLQNYFDASMRELFFNEYLIKRFTLSGNLYSIKSLKSKLNSDDRLTQKVIKMCKEIRKHDIDHVYHNLSNATINKYIRHLIDNGINPIPLEHLNYLDGIKTILEKSKAM